MLRLRASLPLAALALLVFAACDGITAPPASDVCPNGASRWTSFLVDTGAQPASPDLGQCVPRTPLIRDDGQAECLVIEARNSNGDCSCEPTPVLFPVPKEHEGAIELMKTHERAQGDGWDCFCEVKQIEGEGEARVACVEDTSSSPTIDGALVSGWCFVDPTTSTLLGNPALVQACPLNERRLIRFLGDAVIDGVVGMPVTRMIVCEGCVEPL